MSTSYGLFSAAEAGDLEYFQEYNKYNGKNLWFLLIYILRTLAAFCFKIQVAPFEYPISVDYFCEYVCQNSTTFWLYTAQCGSGVISDDSEFPHRNCDKENLVIEMSLYRNVAFGCGGIIGGFLADIYGRKPITIVFSCIWTVLSTTLAFITENVTFSILYTLAVLCASVVSLTTFVNFAEICKTRNRLLAIYTMPSNAIGAFAFYFATKEIKNWKYLMLFVASTIPVMMFVGWYIPESPRWLLNKNMKRKAYIQLMEISGAELDIRISPDQAIPTPKHKCHTFGLMLIFLFQTKWKYFLFFVLFFSSSSLFYSYGKWHTLLYFIHTDQYGLLSFMSEAASFLFILPVYFAIGQRYGLFFIYGLLLFGSVVITVTFKPDIVVYFCVFSILLGYSSLIFLWLYMLDIYPTFVRSTMVGFSMAIFGIISCFCIILRDKGENLLDVHMFYFTFTASAALGLLILLLPPTATTELPNFRILT